MYKNMNKQLIPSNFETEIIILVNKGKRPVEIAKILNLNRVSTNSFLRIKGYKFLPNKGNINYFKTIDSYNKAYIAGFITADGSIVKRKDSGTPTLSITLKHTDRCILEFIKSEIGNTHKIQTIKRPSSFDKTKEIHHCRYTICDKNISQDLINLGITPNKSLTMPNIIPNIPKEYRKAFILGYFDGDGSVSLPKARHKYSNSQKKNILYPSHRLTINIRGTKEFLQGIADELELNYYQINQYDSIPSMSIGHKESIVKFFKCYDGMNFFLKRKYNKFLKRINHASYKLL
jgi:intein/homing endonuclease